MTEFISTNFNKNLSVRLLLLDIEKAFDTVWQRALIYKLLNHNTPKYIIEFVTSYLIGCSFVISVGDLFSTRRTRVVGVPPGSILEPLLFLLSINDIPKHPNTTLILFADDTGVLTTSWCKIVILRTLHSHINILQQYYENWRMKINVNKTETMISSPKKKSPTEGTRMNGQILELTDGVK